jgi:hypothetical protein
VTQFGTNNNNNNGLTPKPATATTLPMPPLTKQQHIMPRLQPEMMNV